MQPFAVLPAPFSESDSAFEFEALDGIEGILLACERGDAMVVSVDVLGRWLGVSVAGYQVEPLPT